MRSNHRALPLVVIVAYSALTIIAACGGDKPPAADPTGVATPSAPAGDEHAHESGGAHEHSHESQPAGDHAHDHDHTHSHEHDHSKGDVGHDHAADGGNPTGPHAHEHAHSHSHKH